MAINIPQVEQYIRQAAQKRGIDPDVAVRVARAEGLSPGVWQSNVKHPSRGREPSYGPFQLLVGGQNGWPTGLGNAFIKQTGLDPRDPSTVFAQVDFALDSAAQGGWTPWYGAKAAGLSPWAGIQNAKPAGLSPEAQEFVKNNPQPGGFGPGIDAPNAPAQEFQPFGTMAPMMAGQSPVPTDIAAYAASEEPKSLGDRLSAAAKAFEEQAPKPPRISPMGSAAETGNVLLKFLNSPTAADLLIAKRLRGVA